MTACTPYTGTLNANGYGYSGTATHGERLAHRIAWVAANGPIPDGLTIDHLCRNKACVNVDHLEVVTYGENTRRAWAANPRTHCRRGHEFTDDNVVIGADGYRTCLTCKRVANREAAARYRAKRAKAEIAA